MTYIDSFGVGKKMHLLHGDSMFGCQYDGTIEECKILGVYYIQKVIDDLNAHFSNLPILNVTRLFSPRHYPFDETKRSQLNERWLDGLLLRFDWKNDIAD